MLQDLNWLTKLSVGLPAHRRQHVISCVCAPVCLLLLFQAPNWLSKLGVVKKELVDEADRARPDVPELAAGYVYLQVG